MLWQHLTDKHSLNHSRSDAASSQKRRRSDGTEFLDKTPDNGLSKSPRGVDDWPQPLSEPTPAACHVDELECLKDFELDETPLDECITEVEESIYLESTDMCSMDDSLFSEFLR
jgi:hypothetical protein